MHGRDRPVKAGLINPSMLAAGEKSTDAMTAQDFAQLQDSASRLAF